MRLYHELCSILARARYRLVGASLALLLLVLMTSPTHAEGSGQLRIVKTDAKGTFLQLAQANSKANPESEGTDSQADISTSGVFTTAQAERGSGLYQEHCQSCHSQNLRGSSPFPPITGQTFFSDWSGRSISELQQYLQDNMPLGSAGSLSDQAYADITAYWLSRHGYPAGNQPLPADPVGSLDLEIEDRRE